MVLLRDMMTWMTLMMLMILMIMMIMTFIMLILLIPIVIRIATDTYCYYNCYGSTRVPKLPPWFLITLSICCLVTWPGGMREAIK